MQEQYFDIKLEYCSCVLAGELTKYKLLARLDITDAGLGLDEVEINYVFNAFNGILSEQINVNIFFERNFSCK